MFRAGRKTDAREAAATFASLAAAEPRSRALPFTISLCIHLVVVTGGVGLDWFWQRSTPYRVLLPEQVIAQSENQIVWYPLQRELPAVAPVQPSREASPGTRPRFRSPQTIVASDPNPDSLRQMILGPAPHIKIEQDIPSPNLLGWSAPRPGMPRFEITEQPARQPGPAALAAEPAPRVQSNEQTGSDAGLLQPRLRLRYLAESRDAAAPGQRALASESAPEIAAARSEGLSIAELHKGERLRFWTDEQTPKAPGQRALGGEAAPRIATTAAPGLDPEAFHKMARLRYWMSEGEAGLPGPASGSLDAGPAPGIRPTAPAAGETMAILEPRALLRYQVGGDPDGESGRAGPRRRALEPGIGSSLDGIRSGPAGSQSGAEWAASEAARRLAGVAAPRESAGTASGGEGFSEGRPGGTSDFGDQPNLAVVGIDAKPNAAAMIPPGQRRGRFAASPEGGPGGGDQVAGPTTSAAVRVPNLSIGGPPAASETSTARSPGARPAPADGAGQKSEGLEIFKRFQNPREFTQIPAAPLDLGVIEDGEDSEALFQNKAVYTLAVNMPNITSYSGSWVIRFAELGSNDRQPSVPAGEKAPPKADALSAPSPRFKVDPKYIRSAADEGIQGKVVLYAVIGEDGHVHRVRVMKGLDERLDDSAVEAFSKWRFDPATSAGLPVGVEAVVEIPFELAPPEKSSRRLRY